MMFLPKESAASMSFAAMLLIYVTGLLVLLTVGQHSHSANAFQMHRLGPRSSKTTAFAARRDDATGTLPQNTNKATRIYKNYNDDIATVWANSLQTKIPLHASSRRYLSEISPVPSLDDEDSKETDKNHRKVP